MFEGVAPGGQAGTSPRIENDLGFPAGISGQALAGRAQAQAQKFGARPAESRAVAALDCGALLAVGGADVAAEIGAVHLDLAGELEPFHLGGQGLADLVGENEGRLVLATEVPAELARSA